MLKNCAIGFCAVGPNYILDAKKLLETLVNFCENHIYVLTDNPYEFVCFPKVITLKHNRNFFSYHDKRFLFHSALMYNDCFVCLDSDTLISDTSKDIDFSKIENGFYPDFYFEDSEQCSMTSFLQNQHDNITYGNEFREYCKSKNYDTHTKHFQESLMVIKENNSSKIKSFLNIWDDLANFCDKKDLERNNPMIGYGEGYSISVSLKTSNIKLHQSKPNELELLKRSIKHLKYERLS